MVWTQTPKEIENFIKILSSLEKTPLWIKVLFLGNNLIMYGKYSSCRFLENSTGFFEYSAEEIISPIGIIFFQLSNETIKQFLCNMMIYHLK